MESSSLNPTRPAPSGLDQGRRGVEMVVLVCVATIWGALGVVFWIPILVRAIGRISVAVAYATLTEDRGRLTTARDHLDDATDFWFAGFENARVALGEEEPDRDHVGRLESRLDGLDWRRLMGNLAWTLVFWLAVRMVFL